MSALTLLTTALAYDDVGTTSNPTQIRINRRPSVMNIAVDNPGVVPVPLAPGASTTVLDGTRTTSIDGTTALSLVLSPLNSNVYRLTHTGGTAPVFRTNRNANVSGIAVTLAVQPNLTLIATAGSGTPFVSVQVGDQVLVPGVSTGDPASPFNALNEGYWFVLSASSTILTLARAAGSVFSGKSEVVTPSDNTHLLAYSAAGVQVGDTVSISAGFAATALHAYEITAVTPEWLEFVSTFPLGNQTGIVPGATGVTVYTNAKRFIMVETDQEILVQLNGDTGAFNRVEPWLPGDGTLVGIFVKVGPCWKLVVQNLSNTNANVLVSSAE